MHARDQLERGRSGHAVVDDRFVQPFECVARNRSHILDTESAHHIDHEVAAAARLSATVRAGRTLLPLARYDLYRVTLGRRCRGAFCSCCRGVGRYDSLGYRASAGESRRLEKSASIERGPILRGLLHAPSHQISLVPTSRPEAMRATATLVQVLLTKTASWTCATHRTRNIHRDIAVRCRL